MGENKKKLDSRSPAFGEDSEGHSYVPQTIKQTSILSLILEAMKRKG
jgi:hypothetical protein